MQLPALDINTNLIASDSPLEWFRRGESDQVAQNERNLLKSVGSSINEGGYLSGAKTAFAGGNVSLGNQLSEADQSRKTSALNRQYKIEEMDFNRKMKLVDFLRDGSSRADTPEKWSAVVDMAGGIFGADKVEPFRDFSRKPEAMTVLDKTRFDLDRLKLEQERAEHEQKMRELSRGRIYQTPSGLVREKPDGTVEEIYKIKNGASDNTPEGRAAAAVRFGLEPNSDAGRAYILTGKMPREDQQSLTATDKKAILEADEMVSTNQAAIRAIDEAEALNDQSYSGFAANERAWAANNFVPWATPQAEATVDMENAVLGQALSQLKSIFGAAPTEGERKILIDLQGSVEKPREVRKGILARAKRAAQARLEFNHQRAQALRGGDFYKTAPHQYENRAGPGEKNMGGPLSPQQIQTPVRVNSPEEAMQLSPGTQFITPDGRLKVRP